LQNHDYVEPIAAYARRLDGKMIGCYESSDRKVLTVSYSEFLGWRKLLSLCATGVSIETVWSNPLFYGDKPFYELLDLTDYCGAYGPVTSKRLLNNFGEYREKMPGILDEFEKNQKTTSSWFEIYRQLREILDLAANNGLMIFHDPEAPRRCVTNPTKAALLEKARKSGLDLK